MAQNNISMNPVKKSANSLSSLGGSGMIPFSTINNPPKPQTAPQPSIASNFGLSKLSPGMKMTGGSDPATLASIAASQAKIAGNNEFGLPKTTPGVAVGSSNSASTSAGNIGFGSNLFGTNTANAATPQNQNQGGGQYGPPAPAALPAKGTNEWYQMTPQEASGGAAGIVAYKDRTAGAGNTDTPIGPVVPPGGTPVTPPAPTTPTAPVVPPEAPTEPNAGATSDRVSQLQALIDNLKGYGTPSQGQQDLIDQIKAQQQSLGLGMAKITATPGSAELKIGRSAALQQQQQGNLSALTGQLANLTGIRQLGLQGAQTAATTGLGAFQAQNPTALGIGQGLFSPVSGQPVGGGNLSYGGGGATSGDGLLNSLAQQVISGQLSPSQAVAQLPSSALSGALNQAITKLSPGYNFANAEQNFQARGAALGQNATTVRPMVNAQQTAIQHLENLKGFLDKVNYGDVPIINGIRTWFSDTLSKDPNIQAVQSEINVVRGEVAKVLGGGSITVESLNEAKNIVPDNLSPKNFATVSDNIQQLMKSKIDQSTNLNNIQQFPTGAPDTSAGGANNNDPLGIR